MPVHLGLSIFFYAVMCGFIDQYLKATEVLINSSLSGTTANIVILDEHAEEDIFSFKRAQ